MSESKPTKAEQEKLDADEAAKKAREATEAEADKNAAEASAEGQAKHNVEQNDEKTTATAKDATVSDEMLDVLRDIPVTSGGSAATQAAWVESPEGKKYIAADQERADKYAAEEQRYEDERKQTTPEALADDFTTEELVEMENKQQEAQDATAAATHYPSDEPVK